MSERNIYLPYQMQIENITVEAAGVRTLRLQFLNEEEGDRVRIQGRTVWRIFCFWSRGMYILHSFSPNPQRIY